MRLIFSAGRSACPELAELVLASPRIHFAKLRLGPNCATGRIVIGGLAAALHGSSYCCRMLSERVARDRFANVLAFQQFLYEEAVICCQSLPWSAL